MIGLYWLLSFCLPACFTQQTFAEVSFTKTGWRSVHVKVPSVQTGHGPDTSAEKEILVLVQVPKKSISS